MGEEARFPVSFLFRCTLLLGIFHIEWILDTDDDV